jgi:TolB protein
MRGSSLRVEVRVYPYGVDRAVLGKVYKGNSGEARTLAHQVADEIVKAITGRDGIASTRIVMVGNRSGKKELYLCDADGGRLMQLTRDGSVSVAPSWGPDGNTIYYTSYLKGFPDLYEIQLRTGDRKRICHYSGLNTGGAVSPDGKEIAVILSKDGNPELYIQHMQSGRLTRLTQTPRAVEASPCWSPDGREIVYVSDQSGRPHLYVVSRRGGRPRRITSRGSENVAPDWGKNGLIAYSSRLGGQYIIAVLDLRTGQTKTVSSGWGDFEDPSWAPDGRHIVCTRTQNYQSSLYILDTLGDSPIELTTYRGDWYSPAWSPGSSGGR